MNTKNNVTKTTAVVKTYKPILLACLFGVVAMGVLLSLFALAYSLYDLPLLLMGWVATAALVLGCFTGGFACAHMLRQKGMMWGGVCGCILFGLLLLICGMLPEAYVGIAAFFRLCIMAVAGMIGGVVGVNLGR